MAFGLGNAGDSDNAARRTVATNVRFESVQVFDLSQESDDFQAKKPRFSHRGVGDPPRFVPINFIPDRPTKSSLP